MSDWTAGLHREVRALAHKLLEEGWEYDRTSNKHHPRLRWPASGEVLSLPSTPSDVRSIPNAEAQARRISGVRPEQHRGPRFNRKARSSGFDLRAARTENARHQAAVDALLDDLDRLDDQILRCNPRREQDRCRRLVTARLALAGRITALGATPTPPPVLDLTTAEAALRQQDGLGASPTSIPRQEPA